MSIGLMTSHARFGHTDHFYTHSEIGERQTSARGSCTTSCFDVWGAGAGTTSLSEHRAAQRNCTQILNSRNDQKNA
eukprot:215419-Amphidinium_carterae.1